MNERDVKMGKKWGIVSDTIYSPSHYTYSSIEPICVIEEWGLGFHLGNVIKYIARAAHKGDEIEDLKKARWYLSRFIERRTHESKL